jgi:hypothetical protein
VPSVVVIRDPLEVMTAALDGGGWMGFKESPDSACELFGWSDLPRSVAEMSNEEYSARVLRRFYTCAGEMAGEQCRILDFDADYMRGVAAFFGIELPAVAHELDRVLGVYAKDPAGVRPFQPDTPRKQRLATGLMRSAALQWATAAYRDLRKRTAGV